MSVLTPSEVVVGIVSKGSSVLMLKRTKAEGALQWNFPGGKVESGEDPVQALLREISEEAGLSCAVTQDLGSRIHPDTGVLIHYFVCEERFGMVSNMEPSKALKVQWVDAGEVPSLVTSSLFEPVAAFLSRLLMTR